MRTVLQTKIALSLDLGKVSSKFELNVVFLFTIKDFVYRLAVLATSGRVKSGSVVDFRPSHRQSCLFF